MIGGGAETQECGRGLPTAHSEDLPRVQVDSSGWEPRYQEAIAEVGAVDLACPAADRQSLSTALSRVPAIPVDRGSLRVYGDVISVTQNQTETTVRVELREALQ